MAQQVPMPEGERLKLYLDVMLSRFGNGEPADDLGTIGDYFTYLAARVNPLGRHVSVSWELLAHFEAVCLVLRERLRCYPEALRAQVVRIMDEAALERLFALLAATGDASWSGLGLLSKVLYPWFPALRGTSPTRRALFEAKVALVRLVGLVKYASTAQLLDYDEDLEGFVEHYNPDLVEKAKLLALINIAKTQLASLPRSSLVERLDIRVQRLEEEIRRPRPRWARVIATCFVLLGVVADLKSVSPDTYDALHRTVQRVVETLQFDGSVNRHRRDLPRLPSQESPPLMLPSPPRVDPDDEN